MAENPYEVEVTNILNELARNPRDQNARNKAREALLELLGQAWNAALERGTYDGKMDGFQLGVQEGYLSGFKAGILRADDLYEVGAEVTEPVKRRGRAKKG